MSRLPPIQKPRHVFLRIPALMALVAVVVYQGYNYQQSGKAPVPPAVEKIARDNKKNILRPVCEHIIEYVEGRR